MTSNSSYYSLNNKYNILLNRINNLIPPSGGYINLITTGNLNQVVYGNWFITSTNFNIASGQLTISDNLIENGTAKFNQGITFSDNTIQTTAYTGQSIATEINVTNTVSNISYKIPLIINSITGVYSLYSGASMSYNPFSNLLSVNINGNSSTATLASSSSNIVVTNNITNTSFYLPFISSPNTGTYALNTCGTMSLNPNSGSMNIIGQFQSQTVTCNAVANQRALNLLNGGLQMLWNAGSTQYTQIQNLSDVQNATYVAYQIDPTYGMYINFNTQGLLNGATTVGQKPRLEIGCGEGLVNEIDFCSSSTTNIGGFNFYTKSNTVPLTLSAKISPTQPTTTDNSTNLATTAWVQSVISSTVQTHATYYQNVGNAITQVYLNNLIQITNLSVSNFYGTNNFITIKYTYISYSSNQTIFISSTGTLMLYPQRISGTVPIQGSNVSFGGGNGTSVITTYNINNNLNGSTTFNTVDPIYAPYGRQYFNSAPTQGLNSGYISQPNSLYMNGTAFTSGGITSTYFGFNLINPSLPTTSAYTYTVELELVQNPYPSATITLLPSFTVL
jgi:hypothetical protein